MPNDTAQYRPVTCYQCGETMHAYWFNDIWNMRIDGQIHKVPVKHVPCHRCETCDIAVTDGGSDEAVVWSYNKYLKENGLNTPWLRIQRWCRKRVQRWIDWYNWYTTRHLRTGYNA